jgi:hypothetical protein
MAGEERSRLAIGFALVLSIALAASIVSGVGVSDLFAGSPAGGLGAGVGSNGAAEPDAAGIGGGLSSTGGAGATPVNSCGTIEEPGRYVLTRNITNNQGTRTSQNCLWINASDVVLEGAGHRIDGIGVTDSVGVYVGSPAPTENVTVRNLTVSDWHKGVWHRGVRDGTLRNVTAENNAIGLGIENATGTRVIDNAAGENLIGVRVTRSTLAALQSNTLEGNYGTGIYTELTAVDLFGQRVTVGPPLDPDNDGRYEDVTGDREVGVYDAVSLFGVVSSEAVGVGDLHADQREMVDLDGDGDLDYGDVWTLL